MKKIISFVLILIIGMTLSACDNEEKDTFKCPEGQELVNGLCEDVFIPATSCDEGDILVQGYCVPDPNPRKPEGEVPKDDVQACKVLDLNMMNRYWFMIWFGMMSLMELNLTLPSGVMK